MSDIRVSHLTTGGYGVHVHEGGAVVTNHRVTIPEDFPLDLGVPGAGGEELVRQTFEFLLEREPATSIREELDLGEVSGYYPEYGDEIRTRLTPDATRS